MTKSGRDLYAARKSDDDGRMDREEDGANFQITVERQDAVVTHRC
jgi:hypothetical protein